ncbi:MAG: 50S ribosomal protein L18 [Candidatus Magasanikbacteria bacterium]|nr:50S ribosomal protein L18 [Candidatus Magasanikbacteria bacterium]
MKNKRIEEKRDKKISRKKRIRAEISGTSDIPRMAVSRTLQGMYIQLIDDEKMKTLASVNSKKDIKKNAKVEGKTTKVAQAYLLGKAIAEKAKKIGIEKIVFDRSGNRYHGRVKAAADGARDGGLIF